MKKLLFLCILLCLSGCQNQKSSEEVLNEVQTHYENLETLEYDAYVVTNIYDTTGQFEINYVYNQLINDKITVLYPESIAGITAEIEKQSDGLNLSFSEVQLETLLPENRGANPVDILSFAIFDIINTEPVSIYIGDTIKISYLDEEISKEVFLNCENYDIISIESYIDDEMVILCNIK